MDVVRQAREALAKYKSTGEIPVLPDDMAHNDYAVWHCVFEDDHDVWETISLVENQRMAKESWDRYVSIRDMETTTDQGKEAFLRITATLAETMVTQYARHNLEAGTFKSLKAKKAWIKLFAKLQPQILRIWLDAFSEVQDHFLAALKEATERHGNFFPESAAVIMRHLEIEL